MSISKYLFTSVLCCGFLLIPQFFCHNNNDSVPEDSASTSTSTVITAFSSSLLSSSETAAFDFFYMACRKEMNDDGLCIEQYKIDGNLIEVIWQKRIRANIGGAGGIDSIAVDLENSLFVGGDVTPSGQASYGLWVSKLDINGNEDLNNWSVSYNPYYSIGLWDIKHDNLNDLYVVGFDQPNMGDLDWLIKKYNYDGSEDTANWNKNTNMSPFDMASSVAVDSNDNVYVSGIARNIVGTQSWDDWIIKKFSPQGVEFVSGWNKACSLTPTSLETSSKIAIDSDDNIYIGCVVTEPQPWQLWLKKFDTAGNEDTINWNKLFEHESGFELRFDNQQNLYCSIINGDRIQIRRWNPDGNEDVSFSSSVSSSNQQIKVMDFDIDKSGNIYVGGSENDEFHMRKYDSNGNLQSIDWDSYLNTVGCGCDKRKFILVEQGE